MQNSYLSPETFNMMKEIVDKEGEVGSQKFNKLLYTYPVLEKQYTLNGYMKNIHELFEEMLYDLKKISLKRESSNKEDNIEKEYEDCKQFYYEVILSQVEVLTEADYIALSQKYGVSYIQKIFSDMEKYVNNKMQRYVKSNTFSDLEIEDVQNKVKRIINGIVRFRNGVEFNPIAEKLLREGGFIRGTRENVSNELLKRRILFANSFIDVYDAIESEEEYSFRAENEKNDIDEIINALYYNRFESGLNNIEAANELELWKKGTVRIVQTLKMVKIIEDVSGKDYFSEFLKIPDVNKLMIHLEKNGSSYLKDCMSKSQIRVKRVIYPATEAENGKYNEYILGKENTENDIKNKILMLQEEMESKNGRNNAYDEAIFRHKRRK